MACTTPAMAATALCWVMLIIRVLLRGLRALRNQDFGECAHCEIRPWCKVCPTRNFNETADMFTHAPSRCLAARLKRKLFSNH